MWTSLRCEWSFLTCTCTRLIPAVDHRDQGEDEPTADQERDVPLVCAWYNSVLDLGTFVSVAYRSLRSPGYLRE